MTKNARRVRPNHEKKACPLRFFCETSWCVTKARAVGIFKKQKLKPVQLRTAARRRFGDANCLHNTRSNERANGVFYLAGFVIECLLKAELLEAYAWLQTSRTAPDGSAEEKRLWSLCYRSHALDEILERLPTLTGRLQALDQRHGASVYRSLQKICAQWTIFARYSPQVTTQAEAGQFLDSVKDLKRWLDE